MARAHPPPGLNRSSKVIMSTDLPPVTFILLAYNQAELVSPSIDAALAQDYPNLEILLSDDCSTDGTYEILEAAARDYRGPHRVGTFRTPRNLHIGGHMSHATEAASGELIVISGGDDISLPHRTRRLVDAWLANGRHAGVLHSACLRFDAEHETLYHSPNHLVLQSLEETARGTAHVIGATEAYARSVFQHFGPFREGLVHEDHALPFRSLLLDRPVLYVEEPLVRYRQGSGVSTIYGAGHAGPKERWTMLTRYLDDALQRLEDLEKVDKPHLRPILERVANRYRVALAFEEGWPRPSALLHWVRVAGPSHVARMIAKRGRNLLLDRRA
jgi:glycosyltransferase involved in cell wall biosynthesis